MAFGNKLRDLVNKTAVQTGQPPKHANLETLQKKPEKPGDWDLKPGDFQNMCKMKIKMEDFLFQVFFYTLFALPIVFFCRIF